MVADVLHDHGEFEGLQSTLTLCNANTVTLTVPGLKPSSADKPSVKVLPYLVLEKHEY